MPSDTISVTAPETIGHRLLARRDRLLANPRFQKWAAAFPGTRWIARRRARDLFDLCAGFVYSQVLAACIELRLFDRLSERPQTAGDLARATSMPAAGMARLLESAVSLRLIDRRGKTLYGLGDLGAAIIGNPGIGAMVRHHALLYADLQDPVGLLRERRPDTSLAKYWPYATGADPAAVTEGDAAAYSGLMSQSQHFVAEEILDAYPLEKHLWLLDVGGGDGTFLSHVAGRQRDLRLTLFDLPAVAVRARARFAARNIADRAEAVGGSFLQDALPTGPDVMSLVRVLHDHDDDAALTILRAVHRALPPKGVVLLAEPMSETKGAESIGVYFSFYLLAMGSGRPRSAAENEAMLRTAGFRKIRRIPTRIPMLLQLLVAER